MFIFAGFLSCISQDAVRAEEYYTIGMAFFDLGKFTEAETWLNRAQAADKTRVATEYNLGRIAFETGRYAEAANYFEQILNEDPYNVMALKGAAYSRIKNGEMEKAEALYGKVLALVPESADDGFNYALVLYGLKKYENCENVLNDYPAALEEKPSSILLLARAQKAMDKIEAVDSYAKWTIINTGKANSQGLFEYAQVLENAGHFARALEQYDAAMEAHTQDTQELKKSVLRFEKARLLLTVDPENEEGMTEFKLAISGGFSDTDAIEALVSDERLNKDNKTEIQRVLTDLLIKEQEAKEAEKSGEGT
jgi:tetratricopeptide (TPR) repeat protein